MRLGPVAVTAPSRPWRQAKRRPRPIRTPSTRVIAATGMDRRCGVVGVRATDPLGLWVVVVVGASTWTSWLIELKRSAATEASALRRASSTDDGTEGRVAFTLGAGSMSRFAITAWAVGPVKG